MSYTTPDPAVCSSLAFYHIAPCCIFSLLLRSHTFEPGCIHLHLIKVPSLRFLEYILARSIFSFVRMSLVAINTNLQRPPDRNEDKMKRSAAYLERDIKQTGLCERCLSIPWQELRKTRPRRTGSSPVIAQTAQALRTSGCPVCRFFADVIISREYMPMLSGLSRPPYTLENHGAISVGHGNIGLLRFQQHGGGRWSMHRGPHVLVFEKETAIEDSPSDPVMLGDMPIELISNSISTCDREHSHACIPGPTNVLRNLRVLDCKRKEIVNAPPGCRYVALSYVWGRKPADVDFEAPLAQQKFPATVSDSCVVAQKLGYRYLWVDRYVSAG